MKKRNLLGIVSVLVISAVVTAGIATQHKGDAIGGKPAVTAYAASTKSTKSVKSAAPKESPAEVAVRAAGARKRHIFVTFYKKGDASSDKMLAAMRSAKGKLSSRANFVNVDVGNTGNQGLIQRYGVDSAPIPLTLVLAPNGAVTAGYPRDIKSTDFSDVFVSDGLADVLKVLQSGKLAAVCVQSARTKFNKESSSAAEGLKADSPVAGKVGVVKIDPTDGTELKFLQQCKVDVKAANAQILLILPPGRLIGKYDGDTTTDKLMAELQQALSSCGTGCAPSGCGP